MRAANDGMDSTTITEKFSHSREIRYEVCAVSDHVKVTIEQDERELSVATNPQSALLIASDIIAAVEHSTASDVRVTDGFEVKR